MEDRLRQYLSRIEASAENAVRYAAGMTHGEFLADEKTQQAVAMNLLLIGEAVASIVERFPEFVGSHAEIRWSAMRGLRNRIAHDYFGLDFQVLWRTVQLELPLVMDKLRAITGDSQ